MEIRPVLDKVTTALSGASGVVSVVLGGSRARSTNRPDSDIDIGIYYDLTQGFSTEEIAEIASKVDDTHRRDIITPLGAWGEWVNGGGWLVIDGWHVDFIFRDIHRVEQVIQDCLVGAISAHYQTGHPHAYINGMYLGEVAICKILTDQNGRLKALKEKTTPYSPMMKKSMVNYFMFEAGFSLMFAEDNTNKDDLYYVAGHLFRAVSCLNQVLFALNEEYCLNEKKAVKMIANFPQVPSDYKKRVDKIFTLLSAKSGDTSKACSELKQLVEEIKTITERVDW
jgi:predicted nucleotidyltransferase